jgi:hypothetical protein
MEGRSRGVFQVNILGICLEGPIKITKSLVQNSRFPGRDMNPPRIQSGSVVLKFKIQKWPTGCLENLFLPQRKHAPSIETSRLMMTEKIITVLF